jgi:isopentenyl-diphosphate delta-isomerase
MRDRVRVVTVDRDGNVLGTADRLEAHSGVGVLHAAVSVQVVSDSGRWLLQRRAAAKPVFGGRWANTCCTHPLPGEADADTVRRRVQEELQLELTDIREVGSFTYRAVDGRTHMVEHEYDRVFLAVVTGEPPVSPDPIEIDEVQWLDGAELADRLDAADAAPWLGEVASRIADALPPGS